MAIDTDAEERQVVLLDTSTAVALVVEDHEAHDATLEAVGGRRLGLAGHAWFETYSVLTRLPAGLRRSPADTLRILARNFPASEFLGEAETAALGEELARLGSPGVRSTTLSSVPPPGSTDGRLVPETLARVPSTTRSRSKSSSSPSGSRDLSKVSLGGSNLASG
jgi:hypothetical protein